jgi:ABC-2 type transport system permease protein
MRRHLPMAARIVRNDLRLFWRTLIRQRLGLVGSVFIYGFLFLMLHFGAWAFAHTFRNGPPLGFESLLWLLLIFPMLGAAIHQSVTVLYERGDLDLLLTSPVPASIVLLTRLVSITAGVILLVGLFVLPPLDTACVFFGPGYLATYVVWLLLALLCSATGTMLTLMLVRWLGARRARVLAQIIGVAAGSAVFLFFQLPNIIGQGSDDPQARFHARLRFFQAASHWADRPLLNLPARAGRGEPWPLLGLTLFTGAVVALSARRLQHAFIEGTQAATAEVAPMRAIKRSRAKMFKTGLFTATWNKDLRLIHRDPLLLTRGFQQCLFMLPAIFIFSREAGTAGPVAGATIVLCCTVTIVLASAAASGEEAFDLLRSSPARPQVLCAAKAAAGATLPFIVAVIVAIALALLGHPWLALATLATAALTVGACAWLMAVNIRPRPRTDFYSRKQGGRTWHALAAIPLYMLGGLGLGLVGSGGLGSTFLLGILLLGVCALGCLACFVLKPVDDWAAIMRD